MHFRENSDLAPVTPNDVRMTFDHRYYDTVFKIMHMCERCV